MPSPAAKRDDVARGDSTQSRERSPISMKHIDPLIAELKHESQTTRRFLEAVPADRLEYKPHEKSMTLGRLAQHIARIPGQISAMAMEDVFEFTPDKMQDPGAPTKDNILELFEKSLADALERLPSIDNEKAMATWKLIVGGREAMVLPRIAMVRAMLMNHLYHHRGQLGVYLRLTGAKVPSSYGPSGDENPIG